jgi:signal transduction histidine kinase
VDKLETATFEIEEERVAWEGLASSCAAPIRRFMAFALVGFTSFIALTSAVIVFYNLFGEKLIVGQGVSPPRAAFYVTMLLGAAIAIGGYLIWLIRSLRSYRAFSAILSRGGLDPRRPTAGGLRAYSDEQLLALRSRYERLHGYAEAFRLGMVRDPEELAKAMERIESESTRMGVLVGDLLSLARLDEVSKPVEETVDLPALVHEAAEDARVGAPDRPIEESLAAAEVIGDRDRLRQVVSNLLANALRHTPEGTAIEISLEASGDAVELRVRDHGPGLPDGAEEQVFERFWRPSSTDHRAEGGLGLAIVRAIVLAHGGTVSAANAEGGGAVFTVTIPRLASSAGNRGGSR